MSDVTDDGVTDFLKVGALNAARDVLPTETVCIAAGAACYYAGVTIDEMFTLHAQARAGGSERAWSWILNGYYDAQTADVALRERAQEVADDAEQRRLGELRADLELDA